MEFGLLGTARLAILSCIGCTIVVGIDKNAAGTLAQHQHHPIAGLMLQGGNQTFLHDAPRMQALHIRQTQMRLLAFEGAVIDPDTGFG